jgi:hypothetical protein
MSLISSASNPRRGGRREQDLRASKHQLRAKAQIPCEIPEVPELRIAVPETGLPSLGPRNDTDRGHQDRQPGRRSVGAPRSSGGH